jgi:hypothetical protein
MTFTPTILTPSWSFQSTTAKDYAGGFYVFGNTPFSSDFTTPATIPAGGSNFSQYAAHAFVVTGGVPGSDLTIQVSGTSITDDGVETPADTQNIVISSGSAVNTYAETPKKWLGQVTFTHLSGPTGVLCNYGLSKYFDLNNQDFCIIGLETLWVADNTDTASDIKLIHHKATGWTYNAGAEPDPPTPIAARETDYSVGQNVSGEQGAWKRANLSVMINGADSEGILFEIDSGSFGPGNLSFRTLTLQVSLYV